LRWNRVQALRPDQLDEIRRNFRRWLGTVAPCEISHVDVFNPCLPEEFEGRLLCVTCGLRQRLALEAAK
jgi:hypothetical protein